MLVFYYFFRAATEICWAVKMLTSLLCIEIHVHMIDNGNNEIRGGGVERYVGGDEKKLIKFAWPNYCNRTFIQLQVFQKFKSLSIFENHVVTTNK